ncbi:putative localization factor protein PodJ [Hyphomonas neptunium ATCC 15444]|uniref:Putative localization factor protein PodJ n=2 Tax=Hyphomonas TaxID=85 RepID=Q0C4E8_HYPNA|nr:MULTISPECIES: peptidoglycan-binding protein [Hyphomonas]ABI75386.1 putative localization factor protein PodJ [Hyphomonas neptunium ATCC 15444]KCZ96393.1 putative localization factor protein PodJ [Hyphomonas hirschiana VP5]
MSQTGPWSVKGIDQRAREAAREAAMAEGITLGEYLNRLLMSAEDPHYEDMRSSYEGPSYGNPTYRNPPRPPRSEYRAEPRPQQDAASALERLSRRIEATEARSTLAITGIDHTVLGLVARIQNAEQTSAAVAGHVEGLIDEMRETHEALQSKVRRMEQDETGKQNLEALKALEAALGKLANHVYEEAELTQNEALAIKGRVESGFSEVTERVEGIDTRVQRSLSETAARIDRAVEQAEQRAEGVTRHLSERMGKLEGEVREQTSQLETRLDERASELEAEIKGRVDDLELQTAARLSDAQKADERLSAVEDDVSGALSSMEATLLRVQERLNRAETTTDTALKGLESTFASLDERIDAVAKTVDPELADRLRKEFDARFEDITELVRSTVDTARMELAGEITRAAEQDAETETQLRSEIGELKARLAEVEARDPEEMTAGVREEIERLGTTVSERIDALAEHVETRLEESEFSSAEAIEQVGEQVTVAAVRLQKRQDEALTALAQEIEASRKTTDARLSDALASVSERLEDIHSQSSESLSPMQRAIAALASRLESLEAFTVPPGADLPAPALTPEAPHSFTEEEVVDRYAETPSLPSADDDGEESTEFEAGVPDIGFEDLISVPGDSEAIDFNAGIADWEDPAETEAKSGDTDESPYGSDFDAIRAAVERLSSATSSDQLATDAAPEPAPEASGEDMFDDAFENDFESDLADDDFMAGIREAAEGDIRADDYDPLAELAGLEEARSEARESDIFDDEDDGAAFIAESNPDTSDEDEAGLIDTLDNAATDRDDETSDYIARARRAALAAADTQTKSRRVSVAPSKQTTRGSNRAPLLIAASAAVLTGAAAGGYLYLRGKQPHDPSLSGPVDTYVDPIFASAPPADPGIDDLASLNGPGQFDVLAGEAVEEDELFDSAAGAIEEDIFGATESDTAEAAEPSAPAPQAVVEETPTLASLSPQPVASYPAIPSVVTVESEANAGNAIAQYQLAQSHLTQNDLDSAIPLLRRAALKGAAPAQYDLGKLYEQGIGVDQDMIQARSLISKAAEAGHVGAMYDLALFMAEGEGGELDDLGAVEWFRKAADHGFLDAQYNLGVMFAEGIGAEQDLAEALYWFELASRQGDSGATLEVRSLSSRLPPETVREVMETADLWSETPSIALANGRFGAQRWNTGNPLQVQAVQTALSRLGYLSGEADGVLGAQTANAIRDYQRNEGLSVSGTVTPELIDRLNTGASNRRG